MAEFVDFYQVLGVAPSATSQQIKDAYRKKMCEQHPDRHGGSEEANRAARMLKEAREVLTNLESRQRFELERRRHGIRAARRLARRVRRSTNVAAIPGRRLPQQVVAHATPSPRASGGDVTVALIGIGLAGLAALLRANDYDPGAGRYRDGRGRFRSGPFS
jgi:curved DNA-binding protein CbpA